MTNLLNFRSDVREWLEENCPLSMRVPPKAHEYCWGGRNQDYLSSDSKLWLKRMAAKGWTAPTWPTEYGGGGLSREEAKVLADEMRRISARTPLISFGLWMIGPVLMEIGTQEQRKEHLPKIISGDIWWCQGFSEPGAGSDLAGIQARAIEDGDDFIINGQKVWTSYANKADWIYALVRTNTEEKHGGITMVIFDMDTPGVSTRPIKLISGESPFCETFFDDVRVPKGNTIGKINGGWAVAKRLLQFERENLSADSFAAELSVDMVQIAKDYLGETNGMIADPIERDRLANLKMREIAATLTVKRVMEASKTGGSTGAVSSILKFVGAELNKDRFEFLLDALGHNALGWEGNAFSEFELKTTREWLRSKANSIEGGTTEINLNIIAKRVLGLRDHQ